MFLLVCHHLIKRNIFPQLSRSQAYRVVRLMLILAWTISLAGLGAWVHSTSAMPSPGGVTQLAEPSAIKGKLVPDNSGSEAARPPSDQELIAALEDPKPRTFSIVCRKHTIHDFEHEYAEAIQLLPGTTSDIGKMVVYIRTLPNGALYVHSNFITDGFEYPTKLASNDVDLRSLYDITMNLVYTSYPSPRQLRELKDAVQTSITFFLDESLFSSGGRLVLDTNSASRLFVVSNGNIETLDRWRSRGVFANDSVTIGNNVAK